MSGQRDVWHRVALDGMKCLMLKNLQNFQAAGEYRESYLRRKFDDLNIKKSFFNNQKSL